MLCGIISEVHFCFNILINLQETFESIKAILEVFSFKEVFTRTWHQISYHCMSDFIVVIAFD